MQIVLSDRAIESLSAAPPDVERAFEKQLRFLASNLLHPSCSPLSGSKALRQ